MSTTNRLTITRDADARLVIQSRDINIKQTFFSWGSHGTGLRIKEHPEYYGRDVDPSEPPPGTVLHGEAAHRWATTNADDHLWEWVLSRESAEDLIELMASSLADPARYRMSTTEIEASEHVTSVLRKALEET